VIDFRYHLVSIIAVFLALAVGLVVGATALSGPALAVLQRLEKTLSRENSALLRDKQAKTSQINADQAFASAAASRLLPGVLADEKVVLVQTYNALPSVTSGLMTALHLAGATVTGTVTLNSSFLDTSGANEVQLKELAYSLASHAGVPLPAELPSSVGAQQAAAKVLAASLLSSDGSGVSAADSQYILTGLSHGNFVSVSRGSIEPASLAILVTPGGPPPQSGGQVLVATAVALRNASTSNGTVMVGAVQSIGTPSPLSAENLVLQVSTVDFADTQVGQITTVWALRELLDGKPPAQYGIQKGAVPTPAPTPSVTPTLTPTPAVSSHPGGHK
jgi:Copper transport outer membrane protein, MctB